MLAEQMGVNPSTVSRAIKGKYVKTPTKVYLLSYAGDHDHQGKH